MTHPSLRAALADLENATREIFLSYVISRELGDTDKEIEYRKVFDALCSLYTLSGVGLPSPFDLHTEEEVVAMHADEIQAARDEERGYEGAPDEPLFPLDHGWLDQA